MFRNFSFPLHAYFLSLDDLNDKALSRSVYSIVPNDKVLFQKMRIKKF